MFDIADYCQFAPKPASEASSSAPLPTVLCKLTMMSLTSICSLKAAPRWTIMECWLSQTILGGKIKTGKNEASAYRLSFVFAAFGSTQVLWPGRSAEKEQFKTCNAVLCFYMPKDRIT